MTLEDALRELEESKAETAACIAFLESELDWVNWRADGWLGPAPVPSSQANAQKLAAFLLRTGHGISFLDRHRALQGEWGDLINVVKSGLIDLSEIAIERAPPEAGERIYLVATRLRAALKKASEL